MEQIYTPKQDYKVLVLCFTYNQSKYIEDALNGFAMQQTNFPFVCLIVDDCSTDGEQDIIKAWMERECDMSKAEYIDLELSNIILLPHQSNPTCTFAFYLLKKNMYGKPEKGRLYIPWRDHCEYEALCEGDDYWIDASKLQKQVNWMDSNPNYSLCCSDAIIESRTGNLDWHRYEADSDITAAEMISGGGEFIMTASIMYRSNLVNVNYPLCCSKCLVGDYPLQIYSTLKGKVRYFSEKMVVYRYQTASSWTSNASNSQLEKQMKLMRSQVDMLEGLNELSNHKYHDIFKKKEVALVYSLLHENKGQWKYICHEFNDVVIYFTNKQKIISFFMQYMPNLTNTIIKLKK